MNNAKSLSRILCFVASGLLLAMAAFHGSGIFYMQDLIQDSDSPDIIKQVFPVLFILPSIELAGLALFGIIAPSLKQYAARILFPLATLVLINALLAFYLTALIPGFILMAPSLIYFYAAYEFKYLSAHHSLQSLKGS